MQVITGANAVDQLAVALYFIGAVCIERGWMSGGKVGNSYIFQHQLIVIIIMQTKHRQVRSIF